MLCALLSSLLAVEPVVVSKSLTLLDPKESEWGQRVSANALADYTVAARDAVGQVAPAKLRTGLRIVIGVKPGHRSRAWIEDTGGKASPNELARMEAAIGEVRAPAVRNGPILFELDASVRGGELPPSKGPPIPPGWKKLVKGDSMMLSALLREAWPDTEAELAALEAVPKNVKYEKWVPEKKKPVAARVEKAFAQGQLGTLIPPKPEMLLIGAFLTQRLGKPPPALGVAHSKLPLGEGLNATLDGAFAKTPEQREAFLKFFGAKHKAAPARVRNITHDELRLVWMFIGWDLTDPLFVVEQGSSRFVVAFDPKGEQLKWIEEISAPCLRAVADDDKALTPCVCLTFDGDEPMAVEEAQGGCGAD